MKILRADAPVNNNWVKTNAGLIVSEEAARAAFPRRPLCGDFFAGAGGFSLGMKQAGFDVVFAVEIDVQAIITYMVNLCRYGEFEIHFTSAVYHEKMEKYLAQRLLNKAGLLVDFTTAGSGHIRDCPEMTGTRHIICGDVRELTGGQILEWCGLAKGDLDCVVGGPPCQGFSSAGKREIMDPRNSLVFEYARLICELQPKTMCMENVPQIVNMVTPEGVPVMDQLAAILEKGDYGQYLTMKKALEAQTGIKLGRHTITSKRVKRCAADDEVNHVKRQPRRVAGKTTEKQQMEFFR